MSFNPQSQSASTGIRAGGAFTGKWQGHTYTILRQLGQGANGTVYLAVRDQTRVALKVSDNPTALSLECERLRALSLDAHGVRLGPIVYEIDDLIIAGAAHPVLVMEYVEGVAVDEFIRARGKEWIPLCLLRILTLTANLHDRGYSFCDLKPANILFQIGDAVPRLIDFGGVTAHGQAVKEFTEMFDRAWWGRGSRKADAAYDVFACALLGLHLIEPIGKPELERLSSMRPTERSIWLTARICSLRAKNPLVSALAKGLDGNVRDAVQFRWEVMSLMDKHNTPLLAPEYAHRQQLRRRKRTRRAWDATDWGLLIAIVIFACTLFTLLWI